MKKITCLVFFAFVFTSNWVSGQSGFGIKGGINFNKVYTDAGSLGNNFKESLNTKTGYNFGVFGRLGKGSFFLQPELMVVSRKGEFLLTPTSGGNPVSVEMKYSNLDIPLLVGFKPFSFLRIMAGPVASLKLSESQKLKDSINGYVNSGYDNVMKEATYGYQWGIGTRILGFEIDLRKEGSLADITALNLSGNSQFTQKSTGWQLTIARKIF
jgi:hypothetical protein